MSRVGLGLCIIGGYMTIFYWIILCGYEIGFGGRFGTAGGCIDALIFLIIGVSGIIGAIIGWKGRKEGYILSIVGGVIAVILIIIRAFNIFGLYGSFSMVITTLLYGRAFNFLYSLGGLFILIGGIYAYIDIHNES